MTKTDAESEGSEQEKGSITPGKPADMVLLSDEIFSIDPVKPQNVRVGAAHRGRHAAFDGKCARALGVTIQGEDRPTRL